MHLLQLKDLSLHGTASEVEFAVLESLKLLIMQQVAAGDRDMSHSAQQTATKIAIGWSGDEFGRGDLRATEQNQLKVSCLSSFTKFDVTPAHPPLVLGHLILWSHHPYKCPQCSETHVSLFLSPYSPIPSSPQLHTSDSPIFSSL
jgi:hypothetical protein